MKKILAVFLCIAMILPVLGCSGGLKGCGSWNTDIDSGKVNGTPAPKRAPVITEYELGDSNQEEIETVVLNKTFGKKETVLIDSGWSQTAGYAISVKKTATDDGTGSLNIYYDSTKKGGGLTSWFAYNFNVVEGREYSVTMSYAGQSGGKYSGNYHCGVSKYADNNSMIGSNSFDSMVGQWDIDWDNLTDRVFYHAPAITFTAEKTGIYSVLFMLYGLHKNGTFWIDDVKVVEKRVNTYNEVTFYDDETGDKTIYKVYGNISIGSTPGVSERDGYVFGGWYDDNGCLYNSASVTFSSKTYKPVFFPEEAYEYFKNAFNLQDEIPAMTINTANGQGIASKDVYIGATMTIDSINEKYRLSDAPMQIKGRGNSSWWCMDKKSYRIKMDSKTKLLGMHSDRNYALISNHCDKSLLRNYLAYGYGASLESLGWAPECYYVHLTINGDYRGLYLLIETVREDNNRIDLSGEGENYLDYGFLAEQVPDDRALSERKADPDAVYVRAGGYYWNIKYPEKEDFTDLNLFKNVKSDIQSRIDEGIMAIVHKDFTKMCEIFDMDAFIDFWLTQELFANFDSFQASIFLYKAPNGKLTYGPLWDFDISINNVSYIFIYPDSWYLGEGNNVFGYAMRMPEFRELCYARIRYLFEHEWRYLLLMVDECAANIEDDWNRNFTRWSYTEKVFETPSWMLSLPDYDSQISFIKTWLSEHMLFLYNETFEE